MQPLETDPAILPDRVTTILDPRGRGLEPQVSTTVASATSSPSRVHCSSSARTSRTFTCSTPRWSAAQAREQPPQIVKGLDVVGGEEVVAVRKGRRHSPSQGLVSVGSDQRVEPDQPVRRAPEVDQLRGQLRWIAAIPPIADDDHHSPVAEDAPRPVAAQVPGRAPPPRAPPAVAGPPSPPGERARPSAASERPPEPPPARPK